jgi:D-beta-D-heptose 7-phosphate kinase / D-beta-D-heptose 1-phosphate adenosyltransferase
MSSFQSIIERFPSQRLLVLGDVMLDRFIYGDVSRISPEAPAPVIDIKPAEEIVGGAGNVARNIASLGARCDMMAIVGRDDAAESIKYQFSRLPNVDAILIEDDRRITTVKTRFVARMNNAHLLRADAEDRSPISKANEDHLLEIINSRFSDWDTIVLSDYGKGVLTRGLISAVITKFRKFGKHIIVDPKGIAYERYSGATVVTPNLAELSLALGRPIENSNDEIIRASCELLNRIDVDALMVTRGERGVLMVPRVGEVAQFDATARRVVDVSGAGDTLVATFALAVASGASKSAAAKLANEASGIVVAKKGTAQVTVDELCGRVLSRPQFELRAKLLTSATALIAKLAEWRRDGLSIGFTNGCFDLLHPGHIQLLCEARASCDRLVVGLNSDDSVRRLKGPTRPLQNETARSFVLAGLAFVDGVVLFDEDTPIKLISDVRPDVLIKGADYKIEQVIGRDIVEANGGRVMLVDLVPNTSTTNIVDKFRPGNIHEKLDIFH